MRDFVYSEEMHQRFYLIRKALGKSQKEMGPPMGYSESMYVKVENKNISVKKSLVLLMCYVYGVRYDYLVFGEEPMFYQEDIERMAWVSLYDKLSKTYKKHIFYIIEFVLDKYKDNDQVVNLPDKN